MTNRISGLLAMAASNAAALLDERKNHIQITGPELKALRNKLGLSVTKASRQVEVSSRSWQRWESGTERIPVGAMKLFRILNGLEKVDDN